MDSLDERILLVWLVATLAVASAIGVSFGVADALFVGVGVWVGPAAFVAATFFGSLYAALCFRAFRFECSRDAIYLERGVLSRVRTVVPLVYVHRVDVRRSPLERLVGLERLVIYTVGNRRACVTISGLSPDRATTIQDWLRECSFHGVPNESDPSRSLLASDR